MNKAVFSVVIPLYNKEKYINRAIASVLNQIYPCEEIIIVNDGSTDKGTQKVKQINNKKVKLVNQENSGVAAARNKGLKLASNNWICLLDADDEWTPNFLLNIKKAIERDDSCIAYASNYIRVKEDGNVIHRNINNLMLSDSIILNYFESLYHNEAILSSSSVCLNKKLLLEKNLIELFPVNIKRGEDLDAWTKLNLNGEIYYYNENDVLVHEVPNSGSSLKSFELKDTFEYLNWLNYRIKDHREYYYMRKFIRKKKIKIIIKLVRNGRFVDAFKTAFHSLISI